MRLTALALALLVSGCAEYYWTRAGTTEEQFYRDSLECALQASPHREAGAKEIRVNDDLYRACLSARGPIRERYGSTPPRTKSQ